MNRVCAVIVTYNRKELLLRNVRSILAQSEDTDILIYDNASDENPFDYLREQGIAESDLIMMVRAKENTGGAGGFCQGMRLAYEKGYEYIWLMDDDGYCLGENTLKVLISHVQNRKAVLNSLVVCDEEAKRLSFSLFGKRDVMSLLKASDKGELTGEICSFNSTLIPRALIERIGYVNPDFFIYGDDTDYIERARIAGYEIITVTDSLYYHPDSGMGEKRVLGQLISLRERSERDTYLYTRNYMYIMKHYRTRWQAIAHIPKVMLKCILYKNNRIKRTAATLRGLYDGCKDRLGPDDTYYRSRI